MSLVFCLLMLLFTSSAVSQGGTVINVNRSDSEQPANKCKVDKSELTEVVAFSVGRKTAFKPSSTSRIPMDHVFYNKGGYFNMKTSIFTAPVSGVYAFYFGGSGINGKPIHFHLYAGNPEAPVASTYDGNTRQGQASGSVIIEMKRGHHASVWLLSGHALNGYTPPSTHFYGYLIKKLAMTKTFSYAGNEVLRKM